MPGKQNGGTPLAGVALVASVTVIVAWLGFLVWLLIEVDQSEVIWTRLLVVLGSVEAVAFAAAGALFGTSVQRQRVEEQRERADANESAALNGQKLAAAIKATRVGVATRENLSADTDPLLELANRLFPD